jgi:hypothetical protein
MNWKFWKKNGGGDAAKPIKRSKPKELPQAVGRKLIVDLQIDPDEAWSLRYVGRPSEGKTGIQDFRLYDPAKAARAGLLVKDWHSLDDHPDSILYEGQYDKSGTVVDLRTAQRPAA